MPLKARALSFSATQPIVVYPVYEYWHLRWRGAQRALEEGSTIRVELARQDGMPAIKGVYAYYGNYGWDGGTQHRLFRYAIAGVRRIGQQTGLDGA